MLWHNPVLSGAITGAALVVFAIQNLYGPAALAFYVQALAILVVGLWAWAFVGRQMQRDLLPALPLLEPWDETRAVESFKKALVHINKALAFAKKVYKGGDLQRSGVVAGSLFVLSQILRLFRVTTLLCGSVLVMMAWPLFYSQNAERVDAVLGSVMEEVVGLYKKHVRPGTNAAAPAATAAGPSSPKTKKRE